MNIKELRSAYKGLGLQKTCEFLAESLESKQLRPEDMSIRDVAEVTLGSEAVRSMDPRRGGVSLVLEDGVDSTAFSNITGQIVYSKILEAYQKPAFWASGIVPVVPTRFSGEKIAGMDRLGDKAETVDEGMPFPNVGYGEDYIETPTTTKRGAIVPVTKEAIFFDRTGLILQRAAEVGEMMGLNKEKRLLDLILGVTNNYKWKGTSYSTYVSTPWDNTNTNTLVDYTDIDEAEQLFAAMTDPATGEPILINPANMTLVVMPDNRHRARSILNATSLVYGIPSSASVQTLTTSPNTLNPYKLQDNTALAKARLVASGVSAADAAKYWFLGDFSKAFAYMENWPITVVQAPANNEAEFTQDIVARYKVSERGVGAVMNPRFVVQSTGAS
jgi:hypothetical protein